MAVKTTQEQIEEVQAAISECLASQELSGPDSRVVRARLEVLQERENMLLDRLRREQGGGPRINTGIMRRD